jgi:hypothetical protein
MATFKEIYNKRRTRTIKVTTTHEERQDITPRVNKIPHEKQVLSDTPKEQYIADPTGTYVKYQEGYQPNECHILSKSDLWGRNNIYVLRTDNYYRLMIDLANPNPPIVYFRKEIYTGEPKYVTITEYEETSYTGEKQYKTVTISKTEDKPHRDTEIAGTALAFTTTLWELLFTSPKLWNWFRGIIHDGYWMIFLSPFVLAYWIIISALYVPFIVLLSLLIVLAVPYTEIVEVPASWMNKEEIRWGGSGKDDDIIPFLLGGKKLKEE